MVGEEQWIGWDEMGWLPLIDLFKHWIGSLQFDVVAPDSKQEIQLIYSIYRDGRDVGRTEIGKRQFKQHHGCDQFVP